MNNDEKQSVSDDEPVEALRIRVLVTNHAGLSSAIFRRSSFNLKQGLQILKERHLLGILHCIVLDVLLMGLQVIQNVVLLSQFGIEEVRVALEFVRQLFVWLVDEFSLVVDSL